MRIDIYKKPAPAGARLPTRSGTNLQLIPRYLPQLPHESFRVAK